MAQEKGVKSEGTKELPGSNDQSGGLLGAEPLRRRGYSDLLLLLQQDGKFSGVFLSLGTELPFLLSSDLTVVKWSVACHRFH